VVRLFRFPSPHVSMSSSVSPHRSLSAVATLVAVATVAGVFFPPLPESAQSAQSADTPPPGHGQALFRAFSRILVVDTVPSPNPRVGVHPSVRPPRPVSLRHSAFGFPSPFGFRLATASLASGGRVTTVATVFSFVPHSPRFRVFCGVLRSRGLLPSAPPCYEGNGTSGGAARRPSPARLPIDAHPALFETRRNSLSRPVRPDGPY
jgi:hypothetical protein